jgi:hypothetical protein
LINLWLMFFAPDRFVEREENEINGE